MLAMNIFGIGVPGWALTLIIIGCLLLLGPFLTGAVLIHERQVGVVIKRFAGSSLAPGQLVALNGEAGYQADTLAPGLHFVSGAGSTRS